MIEPNQTDRDLLERLRNRDAQAFEMIYQSHWLSLYRVSCKILENESVAKDIIQDVFVSLWEKAPHHQILNIKAYLTQAVKYSCFMHLRSGAISQKHLTRINALLVSSSTEDEYDLKELQLNINESIQALPEKCREVFQLSRFEYMSNKKIAEHLNISPKTVENQITKAIRLIRLSVNKTTLLFFLFQLIQIRG